MPCRMDARVQHAYALPPYVHSRRTDVLMVAEGARKLENRGNDHGTIPPSAPDVPGSSRMALLYSTIAIACYENMNLDRGKRINT